MYRIHFLFDKVRVSATENKFRATGYGFGQRVLMSDWRMQLRFNSHTMVWLLQLRRFFIMENDFVLSIAGEPVLGCMCLYYMVRVCVTEH